MCSFVRRSIRRNDWARNFTTWRDGRKRGFIQPEIPEGVKPTHIIVGAGSAGCVLV